MIGRDETAREWARDLARTARHIRGPRDASDTFVAFFVPVSVLRAHRWLHRTLRLPYLW